MIQKKKKLKGCEAINKSLNFKHLGFWEHEHKNLKRQIKSHKLRASILVTPKLLSNCGKTISITNEDISFLCFESFDQNIQQSISTIHRILLLTTT